MGILKKLKSWCPQPRDPFTTKLKRHSAPIAVLLTISLFTVSFSIFSSTYLFNQPAPPQMPVVNVPSTSSTPSAPPAIEWVKNYTGEYAADYASRIIQTSDGGYAIIGTTGAHIYSVPAAWLVKTDSSGNMEWNRTFQVTSGNLTYNLDSIAGLAQTSDGGYVIAGTEGWFPANNEAMEYTIGSAAILFKTDSLGNIEWNQTYPNISGFASMVQTSDGGYVLPGDYSLIKTNSLGIVQWHKSYEDNVFKPNTLNENLVSVVQTLDGGYALLTSDNILFKVNPSGDLQWKQKFEAGTSNYGAPGFINSFIQTADGGYAITGMTYTSNSSNSLATLVKADSQGAVEWNITYGPLGSTVTSLIQASDGGYAFAGTLPGQDNYPENFVWLVKTDSAGKVQWTQTNNNTAIGFSKYSLGGAFSVSWLIETKDGGFIIAGSWNPGITFLDNTYYVVKTAPALPPPTPTPTPSSPPSTGFLSGENLLLFASSALAVILIVIVAVAVLRRRKKQTLAII